MNHKRISLFMIIAVFSFFAAPVTYAQTEDEQVTNADLNVKEARVLPDSAWYGFKRFGRNIRRAFIFDSAKKIEREIQDVNQELADLDRLVNEKKDSVSGSTLKALDSVEKRFENMAKRAPALAGKDEETRRAVMERLLDSEIKRQKLFERIENTVKDERIVERTQETRERMMNGVGDMMKKVTVDEKLIDRVLERQKGTEFKDLRNLEVLKQLEEKVPEEARKAIQQAEDNALKRLNEQIKNNKDKAMKDRLEKFVKEQKILRQEAKEAQNLPKVELKGFDPGPVGKEKPGSEAEKKGLIPLPSGKPTDKVEQRGLIPIPSGDTGPGADTPKPKPSPISNPSQNPRSGGSDAEKKGLIPLPSGKPTDGLERRGLIPIPSGDTGPGGNSGPSPAPKRN